MVPTLRREYENPIDLLRDFDRAVNRMWGSEPNGFTTAAYPVDIRETEDHLIIEAELPGFEKKDVDVTLENGVLSITAQRSSEKREGQAHLAERRFNRVQRRFSLPTTVDESKVDAKLDNGVLTLRLSKREEAKARKITVN